MTDINWPSALVNDDEEYYREEKEAQVGMFKPSINRLSYRHYRVLDFMIANPHMKLGEIADHLKYTQSWVSIIINSDLFKAEYRRRRSAYEQLDSQVIQEKVNRLANLGLDGMIASLENIPEEDSEDEQPSFAQLKAATELALKASGYLSQKPATPQGVNITIAPVTQVSTSVLEQARARMGAIIEQQSPLVIEGDSNEQNS